LRTLEKGLEVLGKLLNDKIDGSANAEPYYNKTHAKSIAANK
jgi:hypothetical protein